jgi:hypothetical protein
LSAFFLPVRSFPLQLPGGAGRRALGAVLEPFGDFGDGRHVDLRRPRPGEYAGDIEVGDGEAFPEQVRAAAEITIAASAAALSRFSSG